VRGWEVAVKIKKRSKLDPASAPSLALNKHHVKLLLNRIDLSFSARALSLSCTRFMCVFINHQESSCRWLLEKLLNEQQQQERRIVSADRSTRASARERNEKCLLKSSTTRDLILMSSAWVEQLILLLSSSNFTSCSFSSLSVVRCSFIVRAHFNLLYKSL
jgi:hypothetical protein